ncbi:MAG: pirin family protein [Bacteroidota bacterium]
MSNIGLIIAERAANIGNFMVGRLLPFQSKRMVGPFCFIDHMGPTEMTDHENLDIGPHPHIGLSTLTYLFDGAINHKDSLGTEIEITPGQVNWMTAGKGIVHSERTPEHLRHKYKFVHGLQIWIALPKELELMEPEFYHAGENEIPTWQDGDLNYKLIAGEVLGHKSPVPVYSPLYLLEIKSQTERLIDFKGKLFGESALYILQGSIESDGNVFGPKQILIAANSELCSFNIKEDTIVYIFGGDAFAEERFIYWNFVASDRELIEKAKARWAQQLFTKVPGEHGFIPLPEPIKR